MVSPQKIIFNGSNMPHLRLMYDAIASLKVMFSLTQQCPQLRSELDRLDPNSDFFEQSGPKKVWIDHKKSELVD